jgi:HNH endonuclease
MTPEALVANPGLCFCGCGTPTPRATRTLRERNWVAGEPIPYVKGHSAAKSQAVKETKFWSKVFFHPSGCWIWTSTLNDKGYGTCWQVTPAAGKSAKAHRVSYELIFGKIDKSLELDHSCRNRACVNPWHLEPVSHLLNMRRGANVKLADDEVACIRSSTDPRRALAERFNISIHTIKAIRNKPHYHRELHA